MEDIFNYSKENLLIVDDEIEAGKTVCELLANLGFAAQTVTSGKDALEELRTSRYTFLITDINMPELNGIELIKIVKEENPDINIVALTGYDKDYTYMDVINAGASDFITKPCRIDEIEAKIKRILIERSTRNELERLSITDNLTGLFNQRHFYNSLQVEIERSQRQKHPLSLIFLDLDNFKEYNDKYGHLRGDEMLAKAGSIILSSIRESVDTAFRYGGDEFAVILVEAEHDTALNIRHRLKEGFARAGTMRASVGLATYTKNMKVNDLIELADRNLYKGKVKNGKQRI